MQNPQHILLVDASPMIYATFNKVGHLSNSQGEPTGLVYGFFRSLGSYLKKINEPVNKVVLAWDLPGPIQKAEGVESYKSDRVMTDEKKTMYSQVPGLRQAVSLTNWTQVDAVGYEADDVIGTVARSVSAKGNLVSIVSTDNDICQLASERVRIWMPPKADVAPKNKPWLKDAAWVTNYFGVPPHHLTVYRSVMGDKSDNIAGITPNTDRLTDLKRMMVNNAHLSKEDLKIYLLKILTDEEKQLFDRNFRLTTLAEVPNLNIRKGDNDPEKLLALFQRMEMKSMYDRIGEFTRDL